MIVFILDVLSPPSLFVEDANSMYRSILCAEMKSVVTFLLAFLCRRVFSQLQLCKIFYLVLLAPFAKCPVRC